MADAAPKDDSPYVANLKFREKELTEKAKRLEATSDADFHAGLGMNRKDAIERNKLQLSEIKAELKKHTK